MTDIASLVLAVDSTQVKTGAASLDGLTAAGVRAEAATIGLGKGAKTAGVAAAAMAAEAQMASRAAVGMAGGAGTASLAIQALGTHSTTSALQIRESLVLMREAARGNFTRMAGSASILAGALTTTGTSVGGLAKQLLIMVGILKVTQDAELAEAATQAAASAAAIGAYAQRAAGAIAAADTELAMAEAAVRVAATSEAEAAAQAQLAAAHEAVAAAASQAVIAEDALAVAQGRAAEAGAASAAAATTSLGAVGIALAGVAVVGGFAFGAMQQFKSAVKDSGELDRYRASLGLTHAEMLKLSDGTEQVSKHIKGLTEVSLTTGDVMAGLWKTIADGAKNSALATATGPGTWSNFKKNSVEAFHEILNAWIVTSEGITAGIYGTFNAVVTMWGQFPAVFGDLFVQGVNAAISALNKLVKFGTDQLNALIDSVNKVPFVNVGHVSAPQIAELDNANAGAAAKAAKAIGDGYAKAYAGAQKADQAFWDQAKKNSKDHLATRMKDEADALIADRTPKKAKKQSDHGLAEALAELDAQIKGQNALAAAYQISDVAAIKAEAMQKAEEQAIRHKGEVGIFYEKELALAVAQRAAEGGKTIADIHAQAAALSVVNDLVEQGIIPVQRMSQALEEQSKKRQLMAALEVAEDKGWLKQAADLRAEIDNLAFSQGVLNEDLARAAALRQIGTNNDATAKLQKEIDLVGASNRARAVGLAILEAQQKILADQTPVDKQQALIDSYVAMANATVTLAEAQNNYNASLTAMLDVLKLIEAQAQSVGQILSNAFGGIGDSIGRALTALATYQSSQQEIADWVRDEKKKAGNDAVQLANIEAQAQLRSKNVQLQAVGSLLEAGKSLFKQHSAGYKAMEAAEKAYAIVQAISTIKSVAAGAAKMFAQLGVWAFPAVGAMIAVMAALGFGGGSSSQKAPTSAADLQKAAGAGTVLGDATAKSASIADSLALMAKNSTKGLDYSSDMVRALRNIESGIGNLTAAIARQLQLQGGFFDTTGKVGTSSSGIQGLFGSTTTKSLYDQGITLNAATIGQIMETGISGATYQVIEKIKKNSGFLGIGGSTKTSYSTTTGALNGDITSQINAIIGDLYTSVVAAAKVLGFDVAAALKQFQVSIGQISFKDLTGQQITDQLNAIFSKIGDQMAGFAVSGLAGFQKAGEGLYETLMRLAKDFLTVGAALDSIGIVAPASIAARESLIDLAGGLDAFVSQVNFFYDHFLSDAQKTAFMQAQVNTAFQALGVSVPASIDDFAKLVTGLDLTSAAGQSMFAALMQIAPAFYDVATAAAALAKKQQDLQVQLLQAQGDTAAATALQRSIALAALDPSLQSLQQAIYDAQDAASAAAAALAIKNKADQMQVELLQAQGKATQALALQRQLELAALDPSLRAIQQQIYNAQDAAAKTAAADAAKAARDNAIATARDNLTQAYQREADALQQTIDKFSGFAATLKAFRDSLFASDSGSQSYNGALVSLMKQAGLAVGGDEGALGGGLQDSAQKFIDVATANAHSLQDVQRAKALVARYLDQAIGSASGHASAAQQQLDQMKAQVSKLVDIDGHVQSVADAIKALTALMFPGSATAPATPRAPVPRPPIQSPAERDKALHDRLDRLHHAMEAVAVSTAKTARNIRDVTRDGASLVVSTDSDTPIKTVAA